MKALITFTDKDGSTVYSDELVVSDATFPEDCDTDAKRLANWLQGANEEPHYALQCVGAELKVTGVLRGE